MSESGRSGGGGADIHHSKTSEDGVKIKGGGAFVDDRTGIDAGGSWAASIADRGRFAGRVVRGGGDAGGVGGWGGSNFFGGRPGVGAVNKKGGGRQHHSVTTGGAAGLSSDAVVLGSTRGAGAGRHGAFGGGGDEVFKTSVGPSGVVGVDVGGTGHPHHSGVTGGASPMVAIVPPPRRVPPPLPCHTTK